MTIGIYSIRHISSNKRYIGKSKNIEYRLSAHKRNLNAKKPIKRIINRYLHSAVLKHGWVNFTTETLETFDHMNETLIGQREIYWMDYYDTCNPKHGYNLRRDTSTGMITHPSTRILQSKNFTGKNNPNYGNKWTSEMKERMSKIKKQQHSDGEIYNEQWRGKQSVNSKKVWKNEELKKQMAQKVSVKKQKYNFLQFTRNGTFVRMWCSIKEITKHNPGYKWQNIYSVCNDYKPSYMGFVWKKILK